MEDQIDGESREEFDMLLGDAQYGLEQIAELVMSLKNFSRVDRSHTELFDLNEGVETSLKSVRTRSKISLLKSSLPSCRISAVRRPSSIRFS